jgi:hypothetical protein
MLNRLDHCVVSRVASLAMSTLGPVAAGVLTGALAAVLRWRRTRPPRWLRPSTSSAEGYAAIMAKLEAQQVIAPEEPWRCEEPRRGVADRTPPQASELGALRARGPRES